jgi:DNA-binding NarL/FixJ family response regulator
MLKIAIVDDHQVVCDGIASMLDTWSKGLVVLKAGNGEEYERALKGVGHVDIAIIDVCMPVRDGYSTLAWMQANNHCTLPLMLTLDRDQEVVSKVVRLGARGILTKEVHREELHLAMDHVSSTGFYMNEMMKLHLIGHEKEAVHDPEGRERVVACLTAMELKVIEHICASDDPTYQMIADRIGVSVNTVHTHRAHIFEKLGVPTRQALLRAAINWKLLKRMRK